MTLKTRGSATLDKAQRRFANLKSIDESLNLEHGLTIAAYRDLIETTRAALDAHNTLISNLDESRKTVTELEQQLAEFSERMLFGVATKYGRNSIQYSKAGGSTRKGRTRTSPAAATPEVTPKAVLPPQPAIATNGSKNGKAKQSTLN